MTCVIAYDLILPEEISFWSIETSGLTVNRENSGIPYAAILSIFGGEDKLNRKESNSFNVSFNIKGSQMLA